MRDQDPPPGRDEKNIAMLAHLLPLLGFLIPGMNIVVPLLIWLTKRNESVYIDHHAREALNFQISLTLLAAIWFALQMMLVGLFFLPLVPVVVILALILMIRAGLKASGGNYYQYPFCVRFVN
ncbi:hypothetical protein GZ77_17215 [Endozoicomonas montiporae]|uniref:Orotate phosphoribosyltransferase n=2 Tax=Endozoicomonas montiporae TaxID=1027273 RepID=A0A081N1H8_9GAMM|nr:DUF4870 domain-containing protein [Endozoicomonas montiporae]KEQ12301.1 hypothetical protein GZ77_17215 [Endozoicomonas montiporae]